MEDNVIEKIATSLQVAKEDKGLIITDEIIKSFIEEFMEEIIKEVKEYL